MSNGFNAFDEPWRPRVHAQAQLSQLRFQRKWQS